MKTLRESVKRAHRPWFYVSHAGAQFFVTVACLLMAGLGSVFFRILGEVQGQDTARVVQVTVVYSGFVLVVYLHAMFKLRRSRSLGLDDIGQEQA